MASEAARAADAPSPAATAPAPWDAGEPAAAAAAAGADVLADEAPAYDMRFDSPGDFFDVRVSVHISFWVADAESACSVRPLPACLSGLLRLHRDEVCACAGHDARWAPACHAAWCFVWRFRKNCICSNALCRANSASWVNHCVTGLELLLSVKLPTRVHCGHRPGLHGAWLCASRRVHSCMQAQCSPPTLQAQA